MGVDALQFGVFPRVWVVCPEHTLPEPYIEARLLSDMGEDPSKKDGGKKARGEFWNGFKTILDTNAAFKEIGFGVPRSRKKKIKMEM